MPTYLLTWNPQKWPREKLEPWFKKGIYEDSWSSGVTKKISPKDRVFLIKLGAEEPRGIMGSGWATSECFKEEHWEPTLAAKGKKALYNEVYLDTFFDPQKKIFPRSELYGGVYSKMHWDAQASGVTIPADVAEQLEKDWATFVKVPA